MSKQTPANTSTFVESTLKQRWYLVENESWADVHLWMLFQRWQNNIETLLIELRRWNVDEPTCFNVEIWLKTKVEPTYVYRHCFKVDKTTLKQRWKSYVDSMMMTQCCFNDGIRLKGKFESMLFIGVEKTELKQLCQYFLYWGSLESGSIIKQS